MRVPLGSLDLSVIVLPPWNGSSVKKALKAAWETSDDKTIMSARKQDRMKSVGPTGNEGSAAERFNLAYSQYPQ